MFSSLFSTVFIIVQYVNKSNQKELCLYVPPCVSCKRVHVRSCHSRGYADIVWTDDTQRAADQLTFIEFALVHILTVYQFVWRTWTIADGQGCSHDRRLCKLLLAHARAHQGCHLCWHLGYTRVSCVLEILPWALLGGHFGS